MNESDIVNVNIGDINFQLFVHSHSEYISNFLRTNKFWESIVTEILIEIFNTIKTWKNYQFEFVDIGANIGYFSLLAASCNLHAIAFEPIKENMSLLQESVIHNNFQDKIQLYPIGLGHITEKVIFNVPLSNMGMASTRDIDPLLNGIVEKREVQLQPFDNFLDKNKSYIVKIDVEHAEFSVLKGMKMALEQGHVKFLILEISLYIPEMYEFLTACGFKTGVNIGFDIPNLKVREKTQHLKNPVYYTSIDKLRIEMLNKVLSNEQVCQTVIMLLHESSLPL